MIHLFLIWMIKYLKFFTFENILSSISITPILIQKFVIPLNIPPASLQFFYFNVTTGDCHRAFLLCAKLHRAKKKGPVGKWWGINLCPARTHTQIEFHTKFCCKPTIRKQQSDQKKEIPMAKKEGPSCERTKLLLCQVWRQSHDVLIK